MPRFTDEWVVDRTMFEYAANGSCACCGFNQALFMPNGVEGLISSISDMETDAANQEISAHYKSPWPLEMRQQVWADRVRLRLKLKQGIHNYSDFMQEHGDEFQTWMTTRLPRKQFKRILQLSRQEIMDCLHQTYNIHSAYRNVMSAVAEQVANFKATCYEVDGIDQAEIDFEQSLVFDRRGGYTLPILDKKDKTVVNPEILAVLLNRIESLGSGKLLNRKPRNHENNNNGGGDADEPSEENAAKPSFRSDRRVVRLLIARHWADALQNKFLKYKQELAKEEEEQGGEGGKEPEKEQKE